MTKFSSDKAIIKNDRGTHFLNLSQTTSIGEVQERIQDLGLSGYSVNEDVIPNRVTPNINENNHNVLMVMLDELVMIESLPDKFKDALPGYNALKNIGLNFTNFHNNRQMCSPSRCVYMSGKIDCGVVDNVEQPWQYLCRTDVKDMNSIGKLFKLNAPNYFTSFFGKSHLDSKLIPNLQVQPRFQNNGVHCMKSYGIDKFNTNGDALHFAHGFYADSGTYNTSLPLDAVTHDIEENGLKLEGGLPFLKARAKDKINFFCEVNFHNPHDIKHFWTVPSQQPLPSGDMLQYGVPYFKQQLADGNIGNNLNDSVFNKPIGNNIYKFDDEFEDAYIQNLSMTTNWFEEFGDETYNDYKSNTNTLLYKETIEHAFWDDDKNNEVNPVYWGLYYLLYYNFTIPKNPFTDSTQIVFWKNFQNSYLTMVKHVDLYLKSFIDYLISSGLIKNTSIVFCADHGDAIGAFGMIEKGFAVKQTENIPLCIYSPLLDDSLKGTTTDKLTSVIDINPTIMSLANIDNPTITDMDGISLFKKNSDGKLVLNNVENKGTFLILDNWQAFTSLFYVYGANDTTASYNSSSYKTWYDLKTTLPMKYAYKQLCYNTNVDGKKYKLVVWYNWLSTIKCSNLTELITSADIQLVQDYINTKFSEYSIEFNDIINDIVEKVKQDYGNTGVSVNDLQYSKQEFIEKLSNLSDHTKHTKNLIIFMISLLIASIRNNKIDDLPSFGHPLNVNTFDEYINVINEKKDVFQQLFNLDDDPNELVNLVDFERTQAERDSNNELIKTKIWDDMKTVLLEKKCETLKTTTKFIEVYYKQTMNLLKENVSDLSSLAHEKLQEFILSPSKEHASVDIFDNMY